MIEVKNLVKCYGGTQKAVDNLTFSVEKGQILGFLGPNGAGKSTTMNIITGYISATSGEVKINGYDILKEPEKAKACIGYLPEIPPVYTDMTVIEYLKFVAGLKNVPRKKMNANVKYAMAATKLEKMERRLIQNLSKGYRQRVGLAATLVSKPEVLILDEPTVGLDPAQIIEIRELIKSLAKKHTVIVSSHIMQEISAVCDRVMIINKGKLVLDEKLEDMYKNVKDSECVSITAETNKAKLEKILKDNFEVEKLDIEASEDEGCVDANIYVKDRTDIRKSLFNLMRDNEIALLKLEIYKMSLEDIFLASTKEEDETDTRKKKKAKKKVSPDKVSSDKTSAKADKKASKEEK